MKIVLLTILVFVFMIVIHEVGHFAVAKLCGVQVNEFSLGMGPKLFSFRKGETQYSIRALPIGGYVSMEGENEGSENMRAFCNQAAWKRFLIVCAGATMNLILGLLLLLVVFAPMGNIPTTKIAQFKDDAVTNQSGLQLGDTIKKINGRAILTDNDIVMALLRSDGPDMTFIVDRDGERVELQKIHFKTQEGEEKDLLYIDFKVYAEKNSVISTLSYSSRRALSLGRMVWLSFADLISGKVGFDQLSGPVGVGNVIGEAASYGWSAMFMLVAFLSINLGIFNLLPIPALDGGRLFFIIVEMIFRKPINRKYEAYVHAGGMILLFGLMIVVTLKDIFQLF